MWTDEAITWFVSGQPVSQLARNSAHADAMFVPYYLFMHFWLGASQSLWWMRLPSLLAGAAAVQALVLLARRWLPPGWAVLAGFLLALNPLFAAFTIQARPYTAAALFAVGSTAALVHAIGRGGMRPWALYGLASACLLLSHLLAGFVLAAQVAGVAAARQRSALAPMLSAIGCAVAAVSPLAVMCARETREAAWIAPSTLGTFHQALADVSGGRAEEVALVVCGLIVTAGLALAPPGGDRALGYALCLAWGAVPVLLLVLAGFVQPLYVSRYAVMAVPGIALIQALAGWRISVFLAARARTRETPVPGTQALAMATLICGAACVAGLALLDTTSHVLQSRFWGDNFRAAAAELSSDLSERPAPVAIVAYTAGVGLAYYVTPPELAHAIYGQALRAYNRHLIDYWGGVTFDSGVIEPPQLTSVVGWPIGAKPEVSKTRCAAGWAFGRGAGPSKTFIVDGSSCLVRRVNHYGSEWVASLSG